MVFYKNVRLILALLVSAGFTIFPAEQVFASGNVQTATPEPVLIQDPVTEGISGFYAVIEGHYAMVGIFNHPSLDAACESVTGDYACTESLMNFDLDGNAVGVSLGFNTSRSRRIFGGDLRFLSLDSEATVTVSSSTSYRLSLDNLIDVRFRTGWMTSDKSMVYLAAGASRVDLQADFQHTGSQGGSYSTSDTGFNIGLGAEYDLSERVFTGMDYTLRRFEFGTDELQLDTVSVRLGYRF